MSLVRTDVAEHLDPVRYDEVETEGVLAVGASALEADAIEKANAGAQLVYALYHRDAEWWRDQPRSVIKAYARASAAYGIGGPK
jgi:hypothetical protein